MGNDQNQLECSQCRAITDPEELAYVDSQRRWVGLGAVARVSFRRDAATDTFTDTCYYL